MSKILIPSVNIPSSYTSISQNLLYRAGFIKKSSSGFYSFMPLGVMMGYQQIDLPTLVNKSLWLKSGRWDFLNKELFSLIDRKNQSYCLAPTHEEAVTDLLTTENISYKQLPLLLFQTSFPFLNNFNDLDYKFRDEGRHRGGLLRSRQFIMTDAYSFDKNIDNLNQSYSNILNCFKSFFHSFGLNVYISEVDPGSMGGNFSQEFHVIDPIGESQLFVCNECHQSFLNTSLLNCPKCHDQLISHNSTELAHIFKLNDYYTSNFNCSFATIDNQKKNFQMGCYGIGISRLFHVISELFHDYEGIVWPPSIAPFHLIVIPDRYHDETSIQIIEKIIHYNPQWKHHIVFDDRDYSFGFKMKDARLRGFPVILAIASNSISNGLIEVHYRNKKDPQLYNISDLFDLLNKELPCVVPNYY